MGEVTLRVGGRRFRGWKEVSVSRSIEALAGTFSIRATELSPDDPRGREILLGDACEVLLDDQVVLSGFVDQRVASWSDTHHEVKIGGRDVTGDLVDCAFSERPVEWRNRGLLEIVGDLVAPFAVSDLEVETTLGARFKRFVAQPSERVFSAIDRACRHRGVLATSDGQGRLVLTRASSTRIPVTLERGKHPVLAGRASFSERERFSLYEFRGQQPRAAAGSALQAADVVGRADDPGVLRFRPTVRMAEEPSSPNRLRERARWEAAVQQGRALRADLTVQGWEWRPGDLWLPNRRVMVHDPWLGVHAELLIAGVTWSKGSRGTTTGLSLAPPEAFDLAPLPERRTEPGPELWKLYFSRFPR